MQAAVEFILQLPVEVEVGQGTSKKSKKSSNRNRKKNKQTAENFESTTPLTVHAKSKSSEMKENISFQDLNIIETKEAKEIESVSAISKTTSFSTSFSTSASTSVSIIPIDSFQINYSSNANHEGEKSRIDNQYNNNNKNDEINDDEKKNDHKNKLNYFKKCEHTGEIVPVLRNIPCISECEDFNSNYSFNKEHDNILDKANYRDVSIHINNNSKKEIILGDNNIISDNNSNSSTSDSNSNDNSNTTTSNSSNSSTQPQSRSDVTHHSASTSHFSESAAAAAIVKLGKILT